MKITFKELRKTISELVRPVFKEGEGVDVETQEYIAKAIEALDMLEPEFQHDKRVYGAYTVIKNFLDSIDGR